MRVVDMEARCPLCGHENHRKVDVADEQFVKERDFSPAVIVCEGCLKSSRVPWPQDILAELRGSSEGEIFYVK